MTNASLARRAGALVGALVLFSATPAFAATPAQKAAIAALVAHFKSVHVTDVEQPSCYLVQSWAQCSFGADGGNAEATAWLHQVGSTWKFLGTDGGVTYASMMVKRYGIPLAVAKQFQAKLCPSPCPGS